MSNPGAKSLSVQANERLRELLAELVDKSFGGNKTHAAKALGVSQSYVTEILASRRGAGTKFLRAVSKYTGQSIDDLMSGRPGRQLGFPRFRELEGWDAAVAEARKLYKKVPPYAFEVIGEWMGAHPPSVDPVTIGNLARDWWERSSDTERSGALIAEAKREMADEDAMYEKAFEDKPPEDPANDGATRPRRPGRKKGRKGR